jgi:hypothetical protein
MRVPPRARMPGNDTWRARHVGRDRAARMFPENRKILIYDLIPCSIFHSTYPIPTRQYPLFSPLPCAIHPCKSTFRLTKYLFKNYYSKYEKIFSHNINFFAISIILIY